MPASGAVVPPTMLKRVVKVKLAKVSLVKSRMGEWPAAGSVEDPARTVCLAVATRELGRLVERGVRTGATVMSITFQSPGLPGPDTRLAKPGGIRPF